VTSLHPESRAVEAGPPAIVVDADALARVGVALADPTRRALLLRLVAGSAFPADLADALGVGRTNVSNHLACLRGCGLVSTEPVGRRVRYSLVDPRLGDALAALASLVLVTAASSTCGPDDYDCQHDHESNRGAEFTRTTLAPQVETTRG